MSYFTDVVEFHRAAGQPVRTKLKAIKGAERELRYRLIDEETEELLEAMHAARHADPEDVGKVARELADLIYVVLGTALHYGLDFDAVWQAVHEANMAKIPSEGPRRREDGKILKPDGWVPADLAAVLAP